MAKSLKIQIEMAGAEEIKRQLEGVGEAGEEAFNKIVAAAKQTGSFKELDPSFLKQTFDELGTKAPEAIGKITQAVKSASRMETLVNALTGVEKGLAGIQTAASAVGDVLGVALVRSLTMVARLLPAAFAAATIGAIANTVKQLRELDAAAIKAGISIADMGKAVAIFDAIGLSAKGAKDAVAGFIKEQEKFNLDKIKEAAANIDEFGRVTNPAINSLKILREAANGSGEAAELARKKLAELGEVVPGISEAAKAIDKIRQSALPIPQQMLAIIGVLEQMGPSAERNRIAEKMFGPEFVQALNAGGVQLELIKQQLLSTVAPSKAAADAATLVALEWQKLKNMFAAGFGLSPEALNAIALSLGQVRVAAEALGTAISAANAAIISAFGGNLFGNTIRELETIGSWLTTIGQLGVSIWSGIEAAASATWQTIVGWIEKAIAAVKQFFSMGGGQAAGAGAQGMARGGVMGGRGSGTSDSNLAWLSRGEHVMPARAVAAPGVLAFLEALRRSGGNLRGVLDRMGHFALGGMVSAPAFARGGAVGGMSNVTIQFPGVQPITGLRASSAVVDELRRSAALAQVRSGGRKPSRYT